MRHILAAGSALLALLPARAWAVDYFDDPLTAASFPGRGSMGGSFGPNGWTVVNESDAVWYEVADALPSGRVEYTVTGVSLATSMTGADHDILTIYQAPTGAPEPVPYSPYFRNNDFKAFTRIFGIQEPGRAGAMKLELAFCPRGDPWYHDEACTAECDHSGIAYAYGQQQDIGWDAATSYHMAVEWSPGQISFYRDADTLGTVTFVGDYAPKPLRIRLGSPRHDGVYPGLAMMPLGITIKDVLISGTPGQMTPICGQEIPDGGMPDGGTTDPTNVGVLADVTAASWEAAVFPDVTDLNVEGASGQPGAVVYLRFPSIEGIVDKAVLRVRTHDQPSAGGGSGIVCAVADDTWSEDTMTWTTRPEVGTACAGSSAPVDVDSVVEWDVTALVQSGRHVNLAIVSTDDDGAHYMSKEAADPTMGPRLLLDVHDQPGVGGAGGTSGVGPGPGAGGSGANGAAPGGDTSSSSCGCLVADDSPSRWALAVVAGLALAARRRQRR